MELASRLSFFLWSSIPDDELLEAAETGRLSDPAELERQVRRMLADPRVGALTRNFAGQWLQLRNLADTAVRPGDPYSLAFDESLYRDPGEDGYRSVTRRAAGDSVAPLARPDARIAVDDLLP